MKGKLFGIGVGPGDPELLTLKAINTIQKCDVIAVPKSGEGVSAAFSVIKGYLNGQELVECHFAMAQDMAKRTEARQIVAEKIIRLLDIGKDVGFVTLGDPTTYSTYMYLHEIVVSKGYNTTIIPGITSYAAAAAALGISLCEDDEMLTIIPSANSKDMDNLLEYPGNKVIMKSGKNLANVLERLKERGYGDRTRIAYRVSMEGEALFANIEDYEKSSERGYFTIAIVKETAKQEGTDN